ncbi:MAG: hypothetical protein OEZ08_05435 [Betaproteobacteria bacterium]|nr:hypothetical protein [Betaproteobacteria bacterium]
MANDPAPNGLQRASLWMLPLAAGLVPALAAGVALALSIRLDLIEFCNPFIDGCVSISRAARHDLPNHVFRALMLPSAVLQAATWVLCSAWLRGLSAPRRTGLRALPWLGTLAGVFLILYGTFLGTEGEAYRWLRRYGINLYFGLTYLAMLVAAGTSWQLARSRLGTSLIALCALVLALGLLHVLAPLAIDDEAFRNRLENILEWHLGLAFTLFFVALAVLWRRTGFAARLDSQSGPTKPG